MDPVDSVLSVAVLVMLGVDGGGGPVRGLILTCVGVVIWKDSVH